MGWMTTRYYISGFLSTLLRKDDLKIKNSEINQGWAVVSICSIVEDCSVTEDHHQICDRNTWQSKY